MSMQKLSRIKSVGAYTAQRSMLENLLLLEEEVISHAKEEKNHGKKEVIEGIVEQYEHEKNSKIQLSHDDLTQYLLVSSEIQRGITESMGRGYFTSLLLDRLISDQPYEIDLKGQRFSCLFLQINSERETTVRNGVGMDIFGWAGAYGGVANINIRDIEGDCTCYCPGIQNGYAKIKMTNIKGNETGRSAGSNGRALIFAENIRGNLTFRNDNKGEKSLLLIGYDVYDEGQKAPPYYDHWCPVVEIPPIVVSDGIVVIKNKKPPYIAGTPSNDPVLLGLLERHAPIEEVFARMQETFWWQNNSSQESKPTIPRSGKFYS